jgi:hypothetical protein
MFSLNSEMSRTQSIRCMNPGRVQVDDADIVGVEEREAVQRMLIKTQRGVAHVIHFNSGIFTRRCSSYHDFEFSLLSI